METTPLHRMVDRILAGKLDETLSFYVDQGLSPGRISLRLAADYQVEVSGQTIKKWVATLPHSKPSRSTRTPLAAQTAQTAQRLKTSQTAQTTPNRGAHVVVSS